MSFRNLNIKGSYRTKLSDVVKEFYIPVLGEAVTYNRAVGFFSSSTLVYISHGICDLAKKGGKIRLITSPCLSEEDAKAIQSGYEQRNEIIKRAMMKALLPPRNEIEADRLALLADLIARGILDVKIALIDNGLGIYHEKLGILEDEDGNHIAFSGSMNESETALKRNYETIDVFVDWDERDKSRVEDKIRAFDDIWNGKEVGIEVVEFPEISEQIIKRYRREQHINFHIDIEEFLSEQECQVEEKPNFNGIELRDYQLEAIRNWKAHKYIGIFDMATGTGKTFTALGAISQLRKDVDNRVGIIIVCPYQHLVSQWVEDIEKFGLKPIIGFSSSPQKDWKGKLRRAIRQFVRLTESQSFCFVCTNQTFASMEIQAELAKCTKDLLLVVDEAHNFGAQTFKLLLDDKYTYRLALSATLERHRDKEGTQALLDFFGDKCIEYSLSKAINEGMLTEYKYYPITVVLTDNELESYRELSRKIAKLIGKGENTSTERNEPLERLLMKRSRLIAGAYNKLSVLKERMEKYKEKNFILVYCGATNLLEDGDEKEDNAESLRQIEAVTQLLGNQLNMKVATFTSEETMAEREEIRDRFQSGHDLQAIVAIKCLDEGVNIPGIKTAFILASTTNPKEYIQRRGRVLRLSPQTGKKVAEIYDFVTLPRELNDNMGPRTIDVSDGERGLVRRELMRVNAFRREAQNRAQVEEYIRAACKTFNILRTDLEGGDFSEL